MYQESGKTNVMESFFNKSIKTMEFSPFIKEKKILGIGAAPKTGITQFLCNLILELSQSSPVFYLSFEESKKEIENRIVCISPTIAADKNPILSNRIFIQKSTLRKAPLKALLNIANKLKKEGSNYLLIDGLNVKGRNKEKVNLRKKELAFMQKFAEKRGITLIIALPIKRIIPDKLGSYIPNQKHLYYPTTITPYIDSLLFFHRDNYYGGQSENGLLSICENNEEKNLEIPIANLINQIKK